MATLATTMRPANITPLTRLIRAHPLMTYFLLAFTGSWVCWLPVALSGGENGLGVIPIVFPDFALFLAILLGGLAGPTLAALVVTGVTVGRAGVRQLLRRCGQWRVGTVWYLLILVGFPLAALAGYGVVYGVNLPTALLAQPSLIASVFLAQLAFSLPTGNFQEEIGWRGFALPRLQQRYGPVGATLVLGTLHSLWHLPLFFTPLLGPTSVPNYAGFVVIGIATTFVYTWIFNRTRGSVLIAALAHGGSNAAVELAAVLIPAHLVVQGWAAPIVNGGWQGGNVLVLGGCALLIVFLTRGRLGYQAEQNAQLIASPPAATLRPER